MWLKPIERISLFTADLNPHLILSSATSLEYNRRNHDYAVRVPMNQALRIYKPLDSKFLIRLAFILLSLPFFIEIFYCFNPHHDGLMLTTVRLTRDSLLHGGDWPFNQYGSFWVFPYTLITFWVPDSLLLIALRAVAVICYLVTAILLWKLSLRVAERKVGLVAILIFLASQPFFSGLGLLPWPSAIAMPLMTSITLLIEGISSSRAYTNRHIKLHAFLAGALIPMLIGTRVQIGLLILITSILFISFFQGIKVLSLFLFSAVTVSLVFMAFLNNFGWLRDSLYDQFVYGSTYLKAGSVDGYSSKPIFTTLGVCAFILSFIFGKSLMRNLVVKYGLNRILAVSLLLGISMYLIFVRILFLRNPSYLFTFTIISRRFWTSLVLGAIAFSLIQQIVRSARALRLKKFRDIELQKRNLLVVFSLVAITQSLPLLDAAHTWWGSAPGVLLVAIVLRERFGFEFLSRKGADNLIKLMVISLLCFTLILDFLHFSYPGQKFYANSLFALNRSDSLTVNSEEKLQNFFQQKLQPGDHILNLCPDTNVFFKEDFVTPSSRIFVYWPNFKDLEEYKKLLTVKTPNAIVYCTPPNTPNLDPAALRLMNTVAPKRELVGDWTDDLGESWKIWRAK